MAAPPPGSPGSPEGGLLPGVLQVDPAGGEGQWLRADGHDFGGFATLDLDAFADLEIKGHGRSPVVVVCSVQRGRVEVGEGALTGSHATGDVFLLGELRPEALRCQFVNSRCLLVALPVGLAGGLDALSASLPHRRSGGSRSQARSWRGAVGLAEQLMAEQTMADSPLVVDSLARLLAGAAIAIFAGPRSPPGGGHPTWPVTVERAVEFIESGPELAIVLADIARAAEVTPRALQLSFRRHLGTSPMAYLRRVRLELARAALAEAVPGDGITVTAVAARWGFSQPGRFAATYRVAFAESPHDTLQRRPVSAWSGPAPPSGMPSTTQFAWAGIRFRG